MDKGGLREELLAASKALVLLGASWTAERQGGWTGEGQVPRPPCVAFGPSSVGIPGPQTPGLQGPWGRQAVCGHRGL